MPDPGLLLVEPSPAASLTKATQKAILRDAKGRYLKGTAPGPGHPHGRDFLSEFLSDLGDVERQQEKHFLRHRWERAFAKDDVASDMMAYLLPKPKASEPGEALSITVVLQSESSPSVILQHLSLPHA